MVDLATLVGLAGVLAYVTSYALLQLGRLSSEDRTYLLLNGAGSVLLLYSLTIDFNLAAFVAQVSWLIFTIVGVIRVRLGAADPLSRAWEPRRHKAR